MAVGVKERHKENKDNPTRWYSTKQEKSVAKAIDGKRTANSGATPWQKGDVLTEDFTIECKTCTKDKQSFTLKEDWFIKNNQERIFMGKPYSAVVFNFGPDKPNYYIVDEITFQEIISHLNDTK